MIITEQDLIPRFDFFGKEKDLEDHIIENIEDISNYCKWGKFGRFEPQYRLRSKGFNIIIDIIIWHKDGTATIIECKKSKTNRNDSVGAIGQLLYYSKVFKELFGIMPRLIVSSPIVCLELHDTIKAFDLPISVLMVDGDRCIYLPNT